MAPAENARIVQKSDRAIAAEIGVGPETVRRAPKSTASHEAVEKGTGKDGKSLSLLSVGLVSV
jgi:hypothetical protein